MAGAIGKVTALITRDTAQGGELLLFRHPHAGVQIPAGTIEKGETPREAALREAVEETGLRDLAVRAYLGGEQESLPPEQRVIRETTRIHARPDETSFDWAYLRRGIAVELTGRHDGLWRQIRYQELDRVPDPQYVSMEIVGWLREEVLADRRERHFFHLTVGVTAAERWTVRTDSHAFDLFWAPLDQLPTIIAPQDRWLDWLPRG